MPTLHLHTTVALDETTRTDLAQALTELTANVLHKRPEVTAVLLHTHAPGQWFIGGAAARQQPTAQLSIDVTTGTNRAEEKAAFVAGAWQLLGRVLGGAMGLAPPSYVIVREVPASDWGYGGLTQAARRVARAVEAGATAMP